MHIAKVKPETCQRGVISSRAAVAVVFVPTKANKSARAPSVHTQTDYRALAYIIGRFCTMIIATNG